ncbi:acetolactate synthase large subunit [Salinisphaera sp.]|uniref:acetolactate synthase large subunit n=1 Tax=Salinisphaera sp. TaxID=1914330 RepID=UPI002D781B38|nr:acetolactate synthase large subunit [Salinisphaera sp.]HET7313683.1 acetolactate synthase large subunit [Salinisphaera sp.]
MPKTGLRNVSQLLVECLESEGVEYVFGIPGEENLHLMDALFDSPIRFVTTRHEQGASFMADIYGKLTGRPGVCLATLGPGAINLALGTADAQLDSHPLVAIAAQAGLNRSYKESHQMLDLEALFRPIVKWAGTITQPAAASEVVRKAFKVAQSGRPGATVVLVPEDVSAADAVGAPLARNLPQDTAPSDVQIDRAIALIEQARRPIVLAGPGVARDHSEAALQRFAEALDLPVATTFAGKGVLSQDHPNALGTIGFMKHDYSNFGFDAADLVIAVGYDLIEYAPERWNPNNDKKIIHIHRTPAEVDANYQLAVGIQGGIDNTLDALVARKPNCISADRPLIQRLQKLMADELERGAGDDSFPVKPSRIVSDIRQAMGREDIVLSDTGALKMWMARLYPCYASNTCLISNGLATMAFSLPGALGAKLACPQRKVLATMGDGSFLMNSQEIETAMREQIPFVILVWVDEQYGLIKWKQELEIGRTSYISFTNPDFLKQAESYGARGVQIESADQLLPALQTALSLDTVTIIACPVDYSENTRLTDRLGHLTSAL